VRWEIKLPFDGTFPQQIVYQKLTLIDHLCATRWTPPDYWQTDNSNGLVMVIHNYHWLNSASRVLVSTCSAPLVRTGERKQFSLFDLDLWPTTLNYNPRLAKVKVDPHAKSQGQRSNGSNRRVPTANGHTHTHGRYQTYHLPRYVVDNYRNRTTTVKIIDGGWVIYFFETQYIMDSVV